MREHKLVGNKWTEIAKAVGGRTDNAVKNRFAALIAKQNGGTASGVKKKKASDTASKAAKSTTSEGHKNFEKKTPAFVPKKQTTSLLPKTASTTSTKGKTVGVQKAASASRTTRSSLNSQAKPQAKPSALSPFKGSDTWVKPKNLSSLKVPSSSRLNGTGNLGLTQSLLNDFSPLVNTPNFNLLTGAEMELLKELNASFSPTASEAAFGFNALTSDKNITSGLPNIAPESPILDMHQVLKWIIAVTPRGEEAGTKATPFASVQPPPLSARQAEFLKSSLEGRLKEINDTPTGDLPPNIPAFSKEELNTLLSALGETPRTTGRQSAMLSRLQNPFGRAT